MSTVATDSLLDEADFLAELGRLDTGMTAKRRSLEEHMIEAAAQQPAPIEPAAVQEESVVLGRVAAIGFLVLMAAVGAAGAVLVFHDRLGLLLSRIQ